MTILELCAAALAAMLGVATASARTEKKDSVDYSLNLQEFVVKSTAPRTKMKNGAMVTRIVGSPLESAGSVDDIFNTAKQDAILDLGNYSLLQGDVFGAGRGNYSFHRVSLSVRYAFNATKSKYKGKSAGEAAIKRM